MRAPTRVRHHGAHRRTGQEGFDRAIERARACVAAGADMMFPEAVTDLAMYRRVKEPLQVPILANITEFGETPLYTAASWATPAST